MFERTKNAFQEISKALDEVCKALQIPFAQTWITCLDSVAGYSFFDGSGHDKLTTVNAPFFMAVDDLYRFHITHQLYHIQKGKGVVGRAFLSHNACFCKDTTKLSIIEYPLVHHAYDAGLTSSFVISLRSSYTGDFVYILEYFLPPVKIDGEDLQMFLDSLLGTMKQHFHSFRVASGELGEKLSVEVIKLSMDDKLNSFEICQTTRSPPRLEALRDGGEITVEVATNSGRNVVGAEQRNSTSYLPMLEACQNGSKIVQPDSSYHKAMTEVDATNSGRNVVSVEQGDSSHWKSMSEVGATNCGRNVVSTEHRAISSLSAVLAL
ncbi:unnamed protein product [Ilex paraguariensis]|uniref:NLP1-9 GAF domain-containing protein n=1 Tax=Ilex paraguariensis TaxID=185542 RepID=A0ABC8UI92_9AQUA